MLTKKALVNTFGAKIAPYGFKYAVMLYHFS